MHVRDIPTPTAVAARPRDHRGFPIPAGVPWAQGVPRFAAASLSRQVLLMKEGRCAICGHLMGGDGRVWTTIDGPAVDVAARQIAGEDTQLHATHYEAPGHRLCVLFSAIGCPYLAEPTARRRTDSADDPAGNRPYMPRGTRRAGPSAVAGFTRAVLRADSRTFSVLLTGPFELHRYDHGRELLPVLIDGLTDDVDPSTLPDLPRYLGPNEAAVLRRLRRHDEQDRAQAAATLAEQVDQAGRRARIAAALWGRGAS